MRGQTGAIYVRSSKSHFVTMDTDPFERASDPPVARRAGAAAI